MAVDKYVHIPQGMLQISREQLIWILLQRNLDKPVLQWFVLQLGFLIGVP
jgi:hypothetical protein